MNHRILLLPALTLALSQNLPAAHPADMEKEYQQVRTIALRDPRVQAAYRDADRKLDAKIVQIDPALDSYVKAKQAAREGTPPPPTKPFAKARTTAKPAPKAAPVKPAPAPAAGTHVVGRGETLGGIAAKHRVSVSALIAANHIQDERKLRVGQVLVIPNGKTPPPPKKESGIWSRLMH